MSLSVGILRWDHSSCPCDGGYNSIIWIKTVIIFIIIPIFTPVFFSRHVITHPKHVLVHWPTVLLSEMTMAPLSHSKFPLAYLLITSIHSKDDHTTLSEMHLKTESLWQESNLWSFPYKGNALATAPQRHLLCNRDQVLISHSHILPMHKTCRCNWHFGISIFRSHTFNTCQSCTFSKFYWIRIFWRFLYPRWITRGWLEANVALPLTQTRVTTYE